MKFGIQLPPPPQSNQNLSGIEGGRLTVQIGKKSFTIDVPKRALTKDVVSGGTFKDERFQGDAGQTVSASFRYVSVNGSISVNEIKTSISLHEPPADPEGDLDIVVVPD